MKWQLAALAAVFWLTSAAVARAEPAAVPLAGVTLLAPPLEDECALGRGLYQSEVAKLKRAKHWIRDAERSTKGLKDALDLGDAGLALIADWLADGAPGGEPRYVAAGARRVVQCSEGDRVEVAAAHLRLNEWKTIEVLRGRVPVFTPAQIEAMAPWLGRDEGLDHEYLRLLIGSFKVQKSTGFLLWGSRRTVGVRGASPRAHHVDEVMRILIDHRDPGLYTNAAKGVLIYVAHGASDVREWGPVLWLVLSMRHEDFDGARARAAMAVGRALPEEHEAAIEHLLTQGWQRDQLEAIAGLEDRGLLDEQRDALPWLQEFAERGLPRASAEAKRAIRKVRRKLRL